MGNAFSNLSKEINKFNDVLNTMSILIWDSRTKMPKKGANSRGYQVGTLTSVARDILLSSKMRKLLDESQNETHNLNDDSFEKKTLLFWGRDTAKNAPFLIGFPFGFDAF